MISERPVTSDPAVMLGRPTVAGTRITVDAILEGLAEGTTVEALQKLHPGLTAEGIRGALLFAADAVRAANPLADRLPLDFHGPHAVELANGGGEGRPSIAIRAYFPQAESVAVRRSETESVPMERIHPDGVYEALFPNEAVPFAYRLAVTTPQGEVQLVDDPHRFSSAFTGEDRRLLADAARSRGPHDEPATSPRRWYEKLGAHLTVHEGVSGVSFAVWAPNAQAVSVVGDFNDWNALCHPLRPVAELGFWELFIPEIKAGLRYKFRITPRGQKEGFDKADPCAFAAELRPQTASVIWDLDRYTWTDQEWIAGRGDRQGLAKPLAIYEVHLGSWKRSQKPASGTHPDWLSYRELADELIPYVKQMGYTHIEPMPIAEHPFDGSWGYQITGYFAATARYGSPDDFRYFVDSAHRAGLGVILDWVPGHFPKDAHGLAQFDGEALYEHPDPRRSENLEWGTSSFNLERGEVAAFLLANALFWIEQYHVDGLRVDAVSSMIYLDYSRRHWLPNREGGRENLAAAAFLRQLNTVLRRDFTGVLVVAEESTAWPRVTGPNNRESLGFDLKWNLGWMHDTLKYVERDPLYRSHHHSELTFSMVYAFNENFLLPFSHDEVVHGKRSMLSKMPGEGSARFAQLRSLYGYQYAHPGKKLQFMGAEFGQTREWSEERSLDWSLLELEEHRQLQRFVRDLNGLYTTTAALYQRDFGWEGFHWIDCSDAERSLLSFYRRGEEEDDVVVVIVNFTPVTRKDYRLAVPVPGIYEEILNSDAHCYGGAGVINEKALESAPISEAGLPHSVVVDLPPLGILFLSPVKSARRASGNRPTSLL